MGSFSAADDVISFTVSNYDAGSLPNHQQWQLNFIFDIISLFKILPINIDQNVDHNIITNSNYGSDVDDGERDSNWMSR